MADRQRISLSRRLYEEKGSPYPHYHGGMKITEARSALAIKLIFNNLSERLHLQLCEGKVVDFVDVMDRDHAVFGFELLLQVPE